MKELKFKNFDFLEIKLASPEDIESWSSGEILRPETINYRTQKSEKGGLFDERVFGPEKDYECYCGKYKGIRYKGIICEKCGVEITKAIVRRRRMGHIELATPVSHIWYLRSIPSRLATILSIPVSELEKVIYFSSYIVTKVDEKKKKEILIELESEYKKKVENIDEEEILDKIKTAFSKVKKEINLIKENIIFDELNYAKLSRKYENLFEAEIGADAIYEICKKLDLKKIEKELEETSREATQVERTKILKRLTYIKQLIKSEVKPEWMFLTKIPVIPPALRPIVSLGSGRHASSDLNDLYRRVLNRNNRLKRLIEINAPDVILRNEKRILQEAVDALIDNNMRHNTASAAMSKAQRRPLKSLSDNIKGKQGIFRQNLLGKRVDYSARSVIVVGPELNIDECGIPKHMALELFRPFIISKLIENEFAHNIKIAGKMIDDGDDVVWAYLEEVIEGKYVLLNRAPTLHKLGILAFKPILTEGQSIRIHPLVCTGFNADFDGDTMSVHLPISLEAQDEAKTIISARENPLKPGNGDLVISSRLDIVLGTYWSTKILDKAKGEGKIFSSPNDAINAYEFGIIDFRAKIKVLGTETDKYKKYQNTLFETTVGRLFFNSYLPSDYSFVNEIMNLKNVLELEEDLVVQYGLEGIPKILDDIKNFGFKYATKSGITWGNDDVVVPEKKPIFIKEGEEKIAEIWNHYNEGLITKEERKRKNVQIWYETKAKVDEEISKSMKENSSVSDIISSGARGKKGNLSTMAGMKGIVLNVLNEDIESPVKSSAKEGLNPLEYFITTHGSRKGLSDTALNTAKAGYLTRKLFDVCQDVLIREEDCKTKESIRVFTDKSGIGLSLAKNIKGRFLAEDIKDLKENVLYKKGHFLIPKDALDIEELGIEEVFVRSPALCKTGTGICQKCYGIDMSGDDVVDLGETVGTIAAQAIGEPGTQLTMRTFHSGGVSSEQGDITMGLPRVEEIFEKRKPKVPAVISKSDGEILSIEEDGKKKILKILSEDKKEGEAEYSIPYLRTPIFKKGDIIKKGDILTDGSANTEELLKYAGIIKTQDYIISESVKIYELQGSSVSRKHIEVVIKQMFSRSKIINPGDSQFLIGDIIENKEIEEVNKNLKTEGKNLIESEILILGITEVSLSRKSFLSSASFQYTIKMLINSSLKGARDNLEGLKENVIIGRLIPAGSGFENSKKFKKIQKLQEEYNKKMEEKELRKEF